jgi:radical SAM superfamily enzyme YgiQ (UPF0313 family)
MKIAIYNLEPKYKNLALEKIRKYYTNNGIQVEDYLETDYGKYDKVYCSSVFDFTNKSYVTDDMICGGSGFNLITVLPPEIEEVKPKLNFGFTSRGCIRKCPFCIVPQKEGKFKMVGDIYDLWDRKSKDITLLDNNILANEKHFEEICKQIKDNKLQVDFNQGLDIRLLNNENIKWLKGIKHKEYKFAFDNIKDEKVVRKGIKLLKKHKLKRSTFYILTGYNTAYKEDLYRANILRGLKQNGFIQRYNYTKDKILSIIARWVNQHGCFHKMTFKEFVMHPKHKNYVKLCQEAGLI